MQGNDQYYENNEGQDFIPRSREVFPKTPWASMGIKAFDFDNDGDQDLILSDMHSDMSEPSPLDREKLKSNIQWPESYLATGGQSIFGNAFFRNDGDGHYTEISDEIGTENYWPWGLSVGDLNANGFEDVFIASAMNYPFSYGVNTLLLNDGGRRFADAEYILGVEPRRNGRTARPWFELECSGEDKDDLLVCQRFNFSGRVVVWGAVGSRSSVIFDLGGRRATLRPSRADPGQHHRKDCRGRQSDGETLTPASPDLSVARLRTCGLRQRRKEASPTPSGRSWQRGVTTRSGPGPW